ncbi:hypothetical protein AB0D78_47570 [Streptomyces avermitilis]|uniref:hypothetical protein n=1 Tax=Streptomyces avermitilis TaxID=33903 RepID=UPI0033D6F50F
MFTDMKEALEAEALELTPLDSDQHTAASLVVAHHAHGKDDLVGIALRSDHLALPNRRPSRRGEWGGQASEAMDGRRAESHTPLPWVPQPYEWLRSTRDQKGRAS